MLETASRDKPKTRPPRSARPSPMVPLSVTPSQEPDCSILLPIRSIPLKLRVRPPSPMCDGPHNLSICSTRSSSSSRTIKRSVSVTAQRKLPTEAKAPVACSAKAWAITNGKTGKVMAGKMEEEMREVASLTKIMTLYAVLQLVKEYDLSLSLEVVVSSRASCMNGTSARLQTGDRLHLIDLLHAMMLPSGNDAAQCLAEFFGKRIAEQRGLTVQSKEADRVFVREMNVWAEKLRMRKTVYQNPHGMSIRRNHSTAKDVNILACAAMRLPLFRNVVNTQIYSCKVMDRRGEDRLMTWENTNKLLSRGYEGVKTGITDAAGPCLCACHRSEDTRIIVTVLGSKSMEERWEEVPRMVEWALGGLSHC